MPISWREHSQKPAFLQGDYWGKPVRRIGKTSRRRSGARAFSPVGARTFRQLAGRQFRLEAARAAARSRRPSAEHSSEPSLLEVVVAGKRLLDAFFGHDPEGGTVRE